MAESVDRNMASGAALSLARLVSGVVRVKVLALALGVAGVGVFGLAQQVNLTASTLVGLGLAVPIINLGRPSIAAGKFAQAGEVAGSALGILGFNIAVLLLLAALFGSAAALRTGHGAIDATL